MLGQSDSLLLIRTVSIQAAHVQADFQGQIYVVSDLNELIKLDDTGNVVRRYSNNYLGQLQLISINNPLQIVLFYPGFQTLIILDNTLNEIKRIGMAELNIPYVTTLGYSPERELWYFDDQLRRFKKVNISGRHILESNLENRDVPTRVNKILIQKNEVKAWCDSSRLITMDLNGNIKGIIHQRGEWIYWKDEITGFFKDQTLITRYETNPDSLIQNILPYPVQAVRSLTLHEKGIATTDTKGNLYIFRKLTKP